jgi:hypothetical protein
VGFRMPWLVGDQTDGGTSTIPSSVLPRLMPPAGPGNHGKSPCTGDVEATSGEACVIRSCA